MDNTNDNNTINPSEKTQLDPCACRRKGAKLEVYDWLSDIPESHDDTDLVEVRFKNTRKGYYRNTTHIKLAPGDLVAVEASPGHDIGEVTLTGRLVLIQMKKNNVKIDNPELKRVYRKAKPNDLEKFEEAKAKEHDTMIRARKIAEDLHLNMKIGDVEYQGDGNKAIFYYIADERVDFRQLIKVLAEAFRVRIEMKQIGARQEAGRIGGLGACGRELCCASWISSFSSVTTGAARVQDISLNPQKLAGQCSKLKCCMMYEYDAYVDARKEFPRLREPLQTIDGEWFLVKSDVLAGTMTFSSSKEAMVNATTLPVSRVREILALNRQGKKPDRLQHADSLRDEPEEPTYRAEEDSITRFDQAKRRKRGGRNRGRGEKTPQGETQSAAPQQQRRDGGENAGERSDRSRPAREGGRGERRSRRGERPRNGEERPNDDAGNTPRSEGREPKAADRDDNRAQRTESRTNDAPRDRGEGNRSRHNRNRRRGGGNAPGGSGGNPDGGRSGKGDAPAGGGGNNGGGRDNGGGTPGGNGPVSGGNGNNGGTPPQNA